MDILFTHDDLDGAGCSIMYELAHLGETKGHDFEIINCSNTNVTEKVKAGMQTMSHDDVVWIADICCDQPTLEELYRFVGGNVYVFDHHPTNMYARDVIGDDNTYIQPVDEDGVIMCGTSIMYGYLVGERGVIEIENPEWFKENTGKFKHFSINVDNSQLMAQFVQDVQDYDTYVFKQNGNTEAKELQVLFSLLGMDRFCALYVDRLKNLTKYTTVIDDLSASFVAARIANEQNVIDSYTIDDIIQFEWNGRKCGLVYNMFANFSEFGNQFLSKHPELDVMVMASFGKDPVFQFRSIKDDIDLGADFAKPIGGGGHPKAAGAPFTETLKESITASIIGALGCKIPWPYKRI